jgi:hypothetical protein
MTFAVLHLLLKFSSVSTDQGYSVRRSQRALPGRQAWNAEAPNLRLRKLAGDDEVERDKQTSSSTASSCGFYLALAGD